ncbi:anti-sigma factor family protein [Maritalea sp.]|uniref:anti-sigma factor family protein n=1 Tax=Maritalea sp. TaxID=2003361 RepID=UPI003EFA6471
MNISDDMLVAYVDGELPQDARKQVEAYLAANPDAKQRVDEWQQNDAALRDAFDLGEEVFEAAPLEAQNDNQRWRQLTRYALAACLLLAIGFGGGLSLSQLPFMPKDKFQLQVAAWANEAHEIFAIDENRPGEFGLDSTEQAASWLRKRVGVNVAIPDLSANDLTFVGARLVGQGGAPAALMTYEGANAIRVSVYVQAHQQELDELGYWFFHGEDKTTCVWLNQKVAFSITGDLPDDELKRIAVKMADGLGMSYRGRNV